MVEHAVTLEPMRRTATGARYRVTYAGKVLVESSRDPEFDSCRALLASGASGVVVTYRSGSKAPCMRVSIERGAKARTADGGAGHMAFVKWQEFKAVA